MKKDSFVLDKKVLLPRMAKVGRRFHPEVRMWRELKACVSDGKPIDWTMLIQQFRLAEMIGPESLRPANRAAHMRLKGVYAFFQMGYIINQDGRIALFNRARHNITTGYSPLISASPSGLRDHSILARKLREQIAPTASVATVEPFAIGFTELQSDDSDATPAYFWLLHRVTTGRQLPRQRSPHPDHDSLVGMKDVDQLRDGRVSVCGEPVSVERQFDKRLLDLLATGKPVHNTTDSALRLLTKDEIAGIPLMTFRVGREYLRRRLKLLGLLVAASFLLERSASALDWCQRSEWVHENADQIKDLLQNLFDAAQTLFQ